MKKSTLYSFLASLLSTAAYADTTPAPLATTNYVDSGLRAVYNKASTRITTLENQIGDGTTDGLLKDVNQLKTTVNGTDGLADQIADLQFAIDGDENTDGLSQEVDDLKLTINGNGDDVIGLSERVATLTTNSKIYTPGLGVDISVDDDTGDSVISVKGADEAEEGEMYVYKDGALTKLETVTSEDWGN